MFKPLYTITDLVASQLSEIAEIKTIVEKSNLLPTREISLKRKAAIQMAHSSTSIEGNELMEHQVSKIALGEKVIADERQIREVKNYLLALKKVDQISESGKIVAQDILSLHKTVAHGLVEKNQTGVFRPGPVYIISRGPYVADQVVYTAPSASYVPKLIDNLCFWLENNNHVHPIIRAALLHHEFESIHPFVDGNGRMGRLLSILHLYQSGWGLRKILVLDSFYNRDRRDYYDALDTGKNYKQRKTADLTNWISYYVRGFLTEAQKLKEDVSILSAVGRVNPKRNILTKDEIVILDFVISLGRITSSDVVDILGIPKRTAQSKLKRLESAKILKKVGAGSTTYYKLPTAS